MSSPSPAAAAASERQAAPDVGEGWTTEEVTRKGGKTAGSKDKYWYSPSGKKFRSKAEIGRYKDALAKEEGDEDAAWKLFKGAKKSTPSSSAKGKAKAKSAASSGTTSSRSSAKKKAASTSPKKKAASASPKKKAAAASSAAANADSSDDDFEKPKAAASKVQIGLAQAFSAASKKKRPAAESDDGGEEKKEDEDGVAEKKMVARKSQKAGKPAATKVRIRYAACFVVLKYICLCNSCTNTCPITALFIEFIPKTITGR